MRPTLKYLESLRLEFPPGNSTLHNHRSGREGEGREGVGRGGEGREREGDKESSALSDHVWSMYYRCGYYRLQHIPVQMHYSKGKKGDFESHTLQRQWTGLCALHTELH